MAIPDFQTLILPLLRSSTDGEIRSIGSVVDSLAREIKLTDEGLRQLLPSGRQATFRNRVASARTYLSKAGLLSSPKRAHFRITPAGQAALATKPTRIDISFLNTFPEFVKFRPTQHEAAPTSAITVPLEQRENPEE